LIAPAKYLAKWVSKEQSAGKTDKNCAKHYHFISVINVISPKSTNCEVFSIASAKPFTSLMYRTWIGSFVAMIVGLAAHPAVMTPRPSKHYVLTRCYCRPRRALPAITKIDWHPGIIIREIITQSRVIPT